MSVEVLPACQFHCLNYARIQWLRVTGCVSGEEYYSGMFEILFKVLDHTLVDTHLHCP